MIPKYLTGLVYSSIKQISAHQQVPPGLQRPYKNEQIAVKYAGEVKEQREAPTRTLVPLNCLDDPLSARSSINLCIGLD